MAPWGNSEDTGKLQMRQLNSIDQLADAMG
jgi:hypothetical protein